MLYFGLFAFVLALFIFGYYWQSKDRDLAGQKKVEVDKQNWS